MCKGIGKQEIIVYDYPILEICSYCKGSGEASVTITLSEYQELKEFKFMYEGLIN
jgi:hypothetical protein